MEPESVFDKTTMSKVEKTTYNQVGNELIRDGKVAVVVLAGGQGSRLGFDGPKGKYDIGLPSGKSLFQILAERFFKAQLIAHEMTASSVELAEGQVVPVVPTQALTCKMFVMTSHQNHEETVQFFRDNSFFGGQESSFVFFPQSMLPALDTEGKIMLETYCSLKLAPNGNGALFEAIRSNSAVQRAISAFQYVQIIGVDNALNKVLDPIQFGLAHERKLQTCAKACLKRNADEKVGVIGKKNGRYNIVEYSEIPPEQASKLDASGKLKFGLGNILVFVCETQFLMQMSTGGGDATMSLYHRAFKKIQHCNPETWEDVLPASENGWKFELFIQNFFPSIQQGKLAVLTVDRDSEFAPVKDKDGPTTTSYGYPAAPLPDTPAFARQMMLKEATGWLSLAEASGLKIAPATRGTIEVSPLLSYEGENLVWLKNMHKKRPLDGIRGYLDHEGDYIAFDH